MVDGFEQLLAGHRLSPQDAPSHRLAGDVVAHLERIAADADHVVVLERVGVVDALAVDIGAVGAVQVAHAEQLAARIVNQLGVHPRGHLLGQDDIVILPPPDGQAGFIHHIDAGFTFQRS